MKKIIGLLLLSLLLYNAVYFKKLSERNKLDQTTLDYQAKIDSIIQIGVIKNTLLTEESELIKELNERFIHIKQQVGNRLGIGESAYFLVKGSSTITSIQSDEIQLANGSTLATQFIFGNEVRDASRMVNLSDFKSQKELNALTEALNTYLREKKIPQEIKGLKVGDTIQFIGACEVSPQDLPLHSLIIYPVEIKR